MQLNNKADVATQVMPSGTNIDNLPSKSGGISWFRAIETPTGTLPWLNATWLEIEEYVDDTTRNYRKQSAFCIIEQRSAVRYMVGGGWQAWRLT